MNKNPKIIMLGDMNVGKTAILQTLVTHRFPQKLSNTLGACYQQFRLETTQGKTISLDIWDTAGQEKYRSLLGMYYKNCDGIILVFDVTKPETLKSMEYWATQISSQCTTNPVIYLVGNKIDLKETHKIIPNEHIQLCCQINRWKFMYCSAKEFYNIEELFQKIGTEVAKAQKNKQNNSPHKISSNKKIKIPKKKDDDDSCC